MTTSDSFFFVLHTCAKLCALVGLQVKLGLLPGWGGTQLLHPIVGLQAALDMILTGGCHEGSGAVTVVVFQRVTVLRGGSKQKNVVACFSCRGKAKVEKVE